MPRILALLLTFSLIEHAAAAPFEAECPEELKTKQSAEAIPKGWSGYTDTVNGRQIFTGLELFNGHPKDGAPLFADEAAAPAPAVAAEGNAKSAPAPETPNEMVYKVPTGHEVYVACQYTNTIVRVIKKIPKGLQSCRVRFSETLGHVQKVVCE